MLTDSKSSKSFDHNSLPNSTTKYIFVNRLFFTEINHKISFLRKVIKFDYETKIEINIEQNHTVL